MINLTFDDGGLAINLAQAPKVVPQQLERWMTATVQHLHAAVNKNIGNGGLIGRRTGNLARSIQELVRVTPDGVIGEVWPDPTLIPYGGIQEEGGTIVPKRGQYLTIPLEAMLTGNGVARGTAAAVRANPGAFGFKASFVPKGHEVIMGKQSNGSAIPLFALKRSVTIPAHHYLATTLIQNWQWIADRLEAATGEIVKVLFGEGAFT